MVTTDPEISDRDLLLGDIKELKSSVEVITRRLGNMEVQNQLLKDENEIFKSQIKTVSDFSTNCAREVVEMKSTDTNSQTLSLKHTKQEKSGQINQEMLSNINKRMQLKPELRNTELPVGFTAVLTHDFSLGSYQTIPFDKVLTNKGNVYNPITGVFKAPVRGLYIFSATTHGVGSTVRTEIQKNGVQVAAMQTINFDMGGHTVVLSLEEDDIVLVRNMDSSSHTIHAGNDRYYSSFSGILVTST
ncbi:collagen alpha-1(X) chain-like [Mytilus trossulus]|uniref:collagen alpha-1(X) chain-like n=1 Tax=Mytilus trossulus TaxID=6551 RepID=UPI0030074B90